MTALALLSANETDLSVNHEAASDLLAGQLDSLSIVTAYSHAISNTVINPVSTPAETWFWKLNTDLNKAKKNANTWVSDIAPAIGSIVPQSIISYNNTFSAVTAALLTIIGDKTSLTAAEKKQVIEIIDLTLATLDDQKADIKRVKDSIDDITICFQADHENLVEGQNGAAKAVQLAIAERIGIENKIGELQTKLDSARAKVTASGVGLGLAIFLTVAAFSLAVATGGAGLIVAGAVGVVGIGTAAAFTGIFTAEISDLINQIHEQQTLLENKKKQVTALSGLVDTVSKLKGHNESAKAALTSISTMWETLGGKLNAVRTNLEGGKLESLGLSKIKIAAAQKSWDQTAAFAQKIQDLASGTTLQPTLQHRSLRLA